MLLLFKSAAYRSFIVGAVSVSSACAISYSTSYTPGIPGIKESFDISSDTVVLLGLTTYMLSLAFECLVFASLSELYGRRPVYLITTLAFACSVIPLALARDIHTILVCRALGGVFGSATIAGGPGTINDVTSRRYRALAFSLWSLGAMNGPAIGPIFGGFVYQYLGWRWINWVILCRASVLAVALFLSKETYELAILRARARTQQEQTGDLRWCLFWNLYVGVIYAILFLCFVSYPIAFQEHRGWLPGIAGLGYCGIAPVSSSLFSVSPSSSAASSPVIRGTPARVRSPPRPPSVPYALGAILSPLGEFWFSWTAVATTTTAQSSSAPTYTHWIYPILAGVSFGMVNTLIFIYSAHYLAGSYPIYAASAVADNAMVRYVFAGALPLAGHRLYESMGIAWTGTLLGQVEVALTPIPFVF
ncbi:MFS general substrate transporter [Aspergillus uvarum CBS 121591]|uniref:MFS general substrate transporter n=1 Tax=Aspergillus uvarum CBS 121591 TaxID=1448315 RepID=A0A319CHN5_9EURO|nr:MFS general substrate transporter [Aspergillus uvarum CBS 121591]PYH83819.1 MFS general substrate transporter [Aspergillus uvarum CBS 121591]